MPKAPEFARPVFLARSPQMAADVTESDWFKEAVTELKKLGGRFADLALETAPFPGA